MRERLYVWQAWPTIFRGLAHVHCQLEHFPFGMADLSIEQADDRVDFTDATGERWRVYDVSFGPPHAKPHHYHRFVSVDQRAVTLR